MQKYSQDEKAKVIGAYKAGNSDRKISRMYGIPKSTVRLWCQNYEVFGEEIYKEKKNYKKWSNEIKVTAVREYLDGHGSISYIKTGQGVLYLSVIRDLYDNSIVAYKTGTEQNVNLVLSTIRAAKRKEKATAELQLHSDQGFQYTSQAYYRL